MTLKEQLINELTCFIMLSKDIPMENNDIMMKITMILSKYDISESCTDIIPLEGEDFNRDCLYKFIQAKIVKGCSKRTIELYSKTINEFTLCIGKKYDQVTADDVILYLAMRKSRNHDVSKVFLNNERRNLSSFFQFLADNEMIKNNPVRKTSPIKVTKTQKEAFSEMEIEILRSEILDNRQKAAFEFLLSTWCRVNEMCELKISDFKNDFKEATVHGKGDKYRTVYLNARAQLAVMNYLEERKDKSPYLFPMINNVIKQNHTGIKLKDMHSLYLDPKNIVENEHISADTVRGWIKKWGDKHGIKAHPHKLRRTGATMALKKGMRIEIVSKLLGHESIETTKIYLDISKDELERNHKLYS